MRFVLVLSAGVALSPIPASAAVSGDTSRDAIGVAASCPIMEGYPDCHPDSEPTWTTPSGRALRTRSWPSHQRRS
jgi:hypothetical protein